MARNPLYTADFKPTPYWWEAAPLRALPQTLLPAEVDVAIVGSGYSGLAAALVTARGGRSTLVLEAEAAGQGCSTRNGGQVSTSLKPTYGELSGKHGSERAVAIRKEGFNALAFAETLIKDEGIDCDWEVVGRFHGAHNPKQYAALESYLTNQHAGIEVPYKLISKGEQRSEIGSDLYHGGVVYQSHASIDPARYHQGLLARAVAAGSDASAAGARPVAPVSFVSRMRSGCNCVAMRAASPVAGSPPSQPPIAAKARALRISNRMSRKRRIVMPRRVPGVQGGRRTRRRPRVAQPTLGRWASEGLALVLMQQG